MEHIQFIVESKILEVKNKVLQNAAKTDTNTSALNSMVDAFAKLMNRLGYSYIDGILNKDNVYGDNLSQGGNATSSIQHMH